MSSIIKEEYIEIKLNLPNELIERIKGYCAVSKKTFDEVVEAAMDEFMEENGDLMAVEWSTLMDELEPIDDVKRMDVRQAVFDVMESFEEQKKPSERQIINQVKKLCKERGINCTEKFIRFAMLDIYFE